MPPPYDVVGEGLVFLGHLIVSFVDASGQILLPRYLVNVLNNFDITRREYSLALLMA